MNCYGAENKNKLVEKYYIKPVMYLGLLNNQEKTGCCGKLTDRYYIFKTTDKLTKKKDLFYAGKHCAEELLKLVNTKPLPFSNPLKSKNPINSNGVNSNNNFGLDSKKKRHPINIELINAIELISLAWNRPPPISVIEIIDFTKKLDEFTINKKGVIWTNSNIKSDKLNRNLSTIYTDLKEENPNLKDYDFSILRNYLDEQNIDDLNRY